MDCIPEKILGITVYGSGEIHIPVSETEVCAVLDNGVLLCGLLSDVLAGDIYNCPTIYDDRVYISSTSRNWVKFHVYSGDYVIPISIIEGHYVLPPFVWTVFKPKWATLQLPVPYDFLVVGAGSAPNCATYVSETLDLRSIPLRYIYLAPGSTLHSVELEFDSKSVPNYIQYCWPVIASKFLEYHKFNKRFHSFGPVGVGSVSWTIPAVRELQPLSDLLNPRFYCDLNQKTFSIHYSLTGGTNEQVIPGYAFSYYCMLGDLKLSGDTFDCETDTPGTLYARYRNLWRHRIAEIYVLEDGIYQEIGGVYSTRKNQTVGFGDLYFGGLYCCPPVARYSSGTLYCSAFCPGNSVGPEALPRQDIDLYKDYLRPPVPWTFDPTGIDTIDCYSDDFCRIYYTSGYQGGCSFTQEQIASQIVRMRVHGTFVNIPYTVIIGGCQYPVTLLENASKYYCNAEDMFEQSVYSVGGTPYVPGRMRLTCARQALF